MVLELARTLSACIANNAKGTQTHSNGAAHRHATQTSHRHGRSWMGLEKTTGSVLTVVTVTYLQHQELVHSKAIH